MSESPLDVEINDPDGYSTSERLKQIYTARRQLREMRTEAAARRRRNPRKAVSFYRTGVESYLMELDTLMRGHELGERLLHDFDFGTVTISPPGEWEKRYGYYVEKSLGENNQNFKVNSRPEPKHVPLKGLLSLIQLPTPVRREFEIERKHQLTGKSTVTFTGSGHIPWETLSRMVSAMNEFVSELGLGLDVEEEDEWKI